MTREDVKKTLDDALSDQLKAHYGVCATQAIEGIDPAIRHFVVGLDILQGFHAKATAAALKVFAP